MQKNILFISILLFASAPSFAIDAPPAGYIQDKLFPAITLQSLEDREVNLPYEVTSTGRVSLVTLTFSRPDDNDMASWIKPFTDKFPGNSRTSYFEIAMIGDVGLINGLIFNGMRAGVSEERKKHVLVYFKDKDIYKRIFNISDDSLIYIYLLDGNGFIRLVKSGKKAGKKDNEEINSSAQALLEPPVKNKLNKKNVKARFQ